MINVTLDNEETAKLNAAATESGKLQAELAHDLIVAGLEGS